MLPWDTVLIGLTLLLGALLQGVAGFGAALVASPLIMLLRPDLIPGAMAFCMVPLVVVMAWRFGRHADLKLVAWAILGWIPAWPVAVLALTTLPPRETGLLFGVLVLVAVGLSSLGLHASERPRNALLAGSAACFMSLTTTIGGPPMALLMQHSPGPRLVGTLNVYFLFSANIALYTYWSHGLFGWTQFRHGAWMIPCVLAGFFLSGPVARWLPRHITRVAVLTISGISGLVLVWRNLPF